MHLHEYERNAIIENWETRFPKCFAVDARQRRSLKRNIAADLERETRMDPNHIDQVLNWYTERFAYCNNLLAGADRIDLEGRKAGTVTLEEHQAARLKKARRQRELAEQRAPAIPNPIVRLSAPLQAQIISPPTMNGHNIMTPEPPAPTLHASLADLQSAITVVSDFLTEERYASLRPVLATTVFREIIAKAETLISELQQTHMLDREEIQP